LNTQSVLKTLTAGALAALQSFFTAQAVPFMNKHLLTALLAWTGGW
jgi:hypothetical protein